MKNNFDKALQFTLIWEGECSNDSLDPGGLTVYGISARYHPQQVKKMYDLYINGEKEAAKDLAEAIYKQNYWDACDCDNLPNKVDIAIFDTAVNLGINKAKEFLNLSKSIDDILFNRIAYYCEKVKENPMKIKFLRGWINRVIALRKLIKER
ncbi:MAG: glycosyl hydrolase 108 family protein [bacterium]